MGGLVKVERKDGVVRVSLNRPDARNALSGAMLGELRAALDGLAEDASVRALVLAGEGKDFCAGADLNEMKQLGAATRDENRADAERLGGAFAAVARFPRAVVGRIQGNVFGGGVGLVAACDIAIVAEDARLAFSEVRLGIIPAVISPYVVRRIGAGAARRLFLTGERFDGAEAARLGLATQAVPAGRLDAAVDGVVGRLLEGSPDAQRRIKLLVDTVAARDLDEACALTPQFIADARASEEGQEGLRAFQEKRKPSWVPGA
jgi:methylglutaconyl-CoA hydratase